MMDFSYFNSAPQPYQYYGLAQTPVTDGNFPVEDFGPVPSNEAHYDPSYAAFQDAFHYDPAIIINQGAHTTTHSPSSRQFPAHHPISPERQPFDANNPQSQDQNADDQLRQRSSSEEKDSLTPQQSKRKAQNRAAQRAFRERKEKHLKDLEAQLAILQQQSMTLDSENDRLKKELAKVATENEILRATSGAPTTTQAPFGDTDELVGPLGFVPTDYPARLKAASSRASESDPSRWKPTDTVHTIVIDDGTGEPLLTAGQTWDYIQAHESFKNGLVDVGDVCERLKKTARCDGHGPVFRDKLLLNDKKLTWDIDSDLEFERRRSGMGSTS